MEKKWIDLIEMNGEKFKWRTEVLNTAEGGQTGKTPMRHWINTIIFDEHTSTKTLSLLGKPNNWVMANITICYEIEKCGKAAF